MGSEALMNYYERLQNGIDYIEARLDGEIHLDYVARHAYMSLPSLYRLFFALTGVTVKGYIRSRRFHLAAEDLAGGHETILAIAFRYGFHSHEAFTRAFKRETGVTPDQYRKKNQPYYFERINLMDQYYEIQDEKLAAKFPQIRVLKKLAPMKVAAYCYVGKGPEMQAWREMQAWLARSGVQKKVKGMRFFGFNNPSPTSPDQEEYGYEVWATLDETVQVKDAVVQQKSFAGGLYAIRHIEGNPEEVMGPAWQELNEWLKDSPYTYGDHQWLEEHIDFDEVMDNPISFDLYMPIRKK